MKSRSQIACSRLPSEPILRYLLKRFGTRSAAARDLSIRLDKTASNMERQIARIKQSGMVTFRTADEILTAYGYHVADFYGWHVYEGRNA